MRKQNQAKGLDDRGNAARPGAVAAGKPVKNPVAKFAGRFNKAQIYADKSKYRRKAKHSGLEPFSIALIEAIEKGSPATASCIARTAVQASAFAA